MVNDSNEAVPESIRRYVQLFYFSYAIGVLVNVLGWAPREYYDQSLGKMLFVGIATFLVMAFVVTMILEGKNWARVFMLISAIIGMPIIVIALPRHFNTSVIGGVMIILTNVMQLYCVYLLFCKSSSDWFKKTPVPAESEAVQGGE